ncbi:MAG: hypothetical protein SFT81_00875 [Candidatus Caenarcaniphilales bacterium]|nr:hypothetical protein [Candidatus Caenarcaniphilales bacterium]
MKDKISSANQKTVRAFDNLVDLTRNVIQIVKITLSVLAAVNAVLKKEIDPHKKSDPAPKTENKTIEIGVEQSMNQSDQKNFKFIGLLAAGVLFTFWCVHKVFTPKI